MKKYVNSNAVPELDKAFVQKFIRRQLDVLSEKGDDDKESKELLEKIKKLDALNRIVSLDWLSTKIGSHGCIKYFDFILKLLKAKSYENARILCILELKGLDAYLNSDKKFKYIWPQFIANNRWRKKFYGKTWLKDFEPFSNLITDGIITLEQCAKYQFAFHVFARLRPVDTGYYRAVAECKKISLNQRRELLCFLDSCRIPLDLSIDEIYQLWLKSGSNIYRDLLPYSHRESLQPGPDGFDFVYHAAKSKKIQLIEQIKSCPRVYEKTEKGVYPIEFIMAWKRSRNDWQSRFSDWHSGDNWKRDNLHLLSRRLKHTKLTEDDAFYFYVTMQHQCEATNLFHSLKKGLDETQPSREDSTSFPLADLPTDIIHVISKHLTLTSVMALTLTCKSIHQVVKTNAESFWKNSLLVTCPRSKFSLTPDDTWTKIASREFKLRYNWIKGQNNNIILPLVQKYDAFDENWGLFSDWERDHRVLFNCNNRKLIDLPRVVLEQDHCSCLFLDSQPDRVPTIVYYGGQAIYIERGTQLEKQITPVNIYKAMAFESNKLICNSFIWDIETATQSTKFNIPNYQHFASPIEYDEKRRSLMLALENKFYVLDPRSGVQTQYDNLPIYRFSMLDDHTIGYVVSKVTNGHSCAEIGTMDLRMMRQELIYSQNVGPYSTAMFVSGIASKAIFLRQGLIVQWDFRERLWERVFRMQGRLLAMNSKQILTLCDDTMFVNDFR